MDGRKGVSVHEEDGRLVSRDGHQWIRFLEHKLAPIRGVEEGRFWIRASNVGALRPRGPTDVIAACARITGLIHVAPENLEPHRLIGTHIRNLAAAWHA